MDKSSDLHVHDTTGEQHLISFNVLHVLSPTSKAGLTLPLTLRVRTISFAYMPILIISVVITWCYYCLSIYKPRVNHI